jgi:hypothetical protein
MAILSAVSHLIWSTVAILSGTEHARRRGRYCRWMTVWDLLTALQRLPRDVEVLAMEAGCEEYCEREVDEVEWQDGGRVSLHLGVRRDDQVP